MGSSRSRRDPANVVEGLVYTLLEVFDATRDLYKTLRIKDKRDHEEIKRRKGYPDSPVSDHLDDDAAAGNASIVLDKAAVTREFRTGLDSIGPPFAVGDVITQAVLQSQIISLQTTVINIFLYGPTSRDPISTHLSDLLAASRAAGTSAVDILSAQRQRMLSALPPSMRPIATPSVPYPVTAPPKVSPGSSSPPRDAAWPVSPTSVTPSVHDLVSSRPKPPRSDTESTSFTGLTSGISNPPQTLYCAYAQDLQRNPNLQLSKTITSTSTPYCPHCKRSLHLSPGKAWEIFKDTDDGGERVFRIQNRFVVKCHRHGEQGYSCVLCNHSSDVDTVCGDVKALVRHIWVDHGVADLKAEEDIVEVVERIVPRRMRSRSDGQIVVKGLETLRMSNV